MSIYLRPGSKNYWCQFMVAGKRHQISTGESTKKGAKAFERKARIAAEQGESLKPQNRTYGDALARYVPPASMESHTLNTEHLSPVLLTDMVKEAHLMKDKMLEEGYSPLTVNRRLAVIKRVLNLAYKEWEWLDTPLGDKIKKCSEKDTAREYYLTEDEVAEILSHMRSPWKEMVQLAAFTGLRQGNILNLQPEWWSKPHLHIPGMYNGKRNTKNGKPLTVTVPEFLHPWMEMLPWGVSLNSLRVEWEAAREKAGMPHIRFHDLRHTFASWMIQKGGMPLVVLQKIMGHSHVGVTEKYAHLAPDYISAMDDAHKRLGL